MTKYKLILALTIVGLSISNAQSNIALEEMLIMNDSIKLPGVLTYNKELEKQPLVIFVPGSGNPDRNGNQPEFGVVSEYIKQFSDAVNKEGIAVFRYDKRNATKDNIKYILKSYIFDDLIKDVETIISTFKDDERFSEIVLLGHSQGSLVAMKAINKHVDRYISLVGIGESADKAIIRQVTAQNVQLGEVASNHIKELKETGSIKDVNIMLAALFAKQNHPFLKSYFSLDPQEEIKHIVVPTIIIGGGKDSQVRVEDARLLHKANPNAEMVIIENMNHVLKTIEKDEDNLKSYYSKEYTLSDKLVEIVATFIKK